MTLFGARWSLRGLRHQDRAHFADLLRRARPPVEAGYVSATAASAMTKVFKANPGKYNFASPGAGSIPHLLGEMLRISFGLDLVHVLRQRSNASVTRHG